MKYTSFDYFKAFLVFLAILAFGAFEWLSANFRIAAMLSLPLISLVFLFKNTYQIKKDYLTVSTFGKTFKKIWLGDIEKVEIGKTFYGRKVVKVFYDPYNYLTVQLGDQAEAFIKELNAALPNQSNIA